MAKKHHRTRKISNQKKGGGTICTKPDNISITNEEQLVEAIKDTNIDLVADILDNHANASELNINYITCDDKSFLELAIESDDSLEQSILQLLLHAGANPHTKNKDGDTALHYAAKMNYHSLLELIGIHTIQIDVRNNKGQTPLMLAVQNSQKDSVKILVEFGADVNAKDKKSIPVIFYLDSLNNEDKIFMAQSLCKNINVSHPICNQAYRDVNLYGRGLVVLPEYAFNPNVALLDCTGNNLREIPKLPRNLIELKCSNNYLTWLPRLPNTLKRLVCDGNPIEIIPELPNNLEYLNCSSTQVKKLPKLPNTLINILCSHTKLETIPNLPENLTIINFEHNPLSEPYITYYNTYIQTNDINKFIHDVNSYNNEIKRRGRNESTLRQTLGIQENIGRRRGEFAQNQPSITASLPANALSVVSSFLTGKNGPQYRNSSRNKPTQVEQLKRAVGYRKSRKSRKSRKY